MRTPLVLLRILTVIGISYIYNIMNLQENIQRIKQMMGLNEIANPYKVDWEYPTQEYFTLVIW